MKTKEIYELLEEIVSALIRKANEQRQDKELPEEILAYTEGQLYEAQYLKGKIEEIIFD